MNQTNINDSQISELWHLKLITRHVTQPSIDTFMLTLDTCT